MQNPRWQNPDSSDAHFEDSYQPYREIEQRRGTLGQFIERSTSAPPSSSAFFGKPNEDKFASKGDSFVGNDLLEYVTKGYTHNTAQDSSIEREQKYSNFRNDDRFGVNWLGSEAENDNVSDLLGTGNNVLGRNYGNAGSLQARPLSASGDGQGRFETRSNSLYDDLPLSLGSGIVRSQSAAPSSSARHSFLSPPPGLSDLNEDSFSTPRESRINQWGQGIRRPASAGVLGGSSVLASNALRPNPKTLMDLIQEDSPPDEHNIQSDVSILNDQGNNFRNHSTAVSPYGIDAGGRRSASPAISRQHQIKSTVHPIRSPAQTSVYVDAAGPQGQHSYHGQHHQQLKEEKQYQDGYQQQIALKNYQAPYSEPKPHQVHVEQYELPFNPEQQYQTQTLKQQRGTGNVGSYTVPGQQLPLEDIAHSQMYQHGHQPFHQQSHQTHQPQQQMYYNGQRVEVNPSMQSQGILGPAMQANQGIHPSALQGIQMQGLQTAQTIQLPNGQTVYVSTVPPPQQNYGYTSVQYHSPQHQGQMIQQGMRPVQNNEDGQYVSVVPVQGGPAMSYWQPNNVNSQHVSLGMANVGGVSGPISISRVQGPPDGSSSLHSHQGMHNHFVGGPGTATPRGHEKVMKGRRNSAPTSGRRNSDTKVTSTPASSPLLEEFRTSKSRDWTMRRIEGFVVEFCQDQNGSRFIQQRLEMGDVSEQQIVMNEVLPAIRRLRNDVFGNYVVQKLLDFGTPKMKADIQKTIDGEMVPLSLQMYGCRVVQKALEALNEDDLPILLQEFHHNVLSCIHDQNGNHVIQKCIEVLNSRANKCADKSRSIFLREQIDFIINDVLVNTTSLSCHPYGCRVLQRILEHCSDAKKSKILDEIKKCHEKLLDDQYGNYVIQHVLQFGREEDRDSILGIVVKNGLLILSRQKFASNVVEKLLKYGNAKQRRAVVREMLKNADDPSKPSEPSDGSTSVAILMVRDAYANYVVQTTLDVVPESEEKQMLLAELNSHAEELRNYTFAKHIVTKLSSVNSES